MNFEEGRYKASPCMKILRENPRRLNFKARPGMCETMNTTMKEPNCPSENPKLNFKGKPEMCEALDITSDMTKHVRRTRQSRHVLIESRGRRGHRARSPQPAHKSEGSCVQNCLELPQSNFMNGESTTHEVRSLRTKVN